MNTQLQKQFDKLEAQRAHLLGLISSLSSEQLNAHPEGKWSIAQILSHLISSEQLTVKYVNKKILGIKESPNTGIIEELIMIVVIVSQRLPFLKFKAPRVLAENTTSYQTVEELIKAWDLVRSALKETLVLIHGDELKRKVYKHPVAGKLNIQQGLIFLREHTHHHTPQIKNLLRQK